MTMPLTIDVRRSDGDVTKLQGVAGVAVMLQTDFELEDFDSAEDMMRHLPDMPIVSLRADNKGQLAVILAGLLASVRDTAGGEVVSTAFALAPFIDAREPQLYREAPPLRHG